MSTPRHYLHLLMLARKWQEVAETKTNSEDIIQTNFQFQQFSVRFAMNDHIAVKHGFYEQFSSIFAVREQ